MSATKRAAIELIQRLPDNCTLADIRYSLYVQERIEEGMEALERGDVVPHSEVERRMKAWMKSRGRRRRSGTSGKRAST